MMFIELFAPQGAFSVAQRREIGERFINEIMSEEFGAESLINGIRSVCQVVVHEPVSWIVGGRDADVEAAPRYLARVSVPGAWRKDMSEMFIQRITAILADYDSDPNRLYEQPHALVQVVGIPEHSYGAFGKVLTSTDITRLVTAGYRGSPENAAAVANVPAGMAIDPVCGMTASLTDAAITLHHEGTTYAFCSVQCRTVFAEDNGIPVQAAATTA